jgi:hypothetical protein
LFYRKIIRGELVMPDLKVRRNFKESVEKALKEYVECERCLTHLPYVSGVCTRCPNCGWYECNPIVMRKEVRA